MYKMVVFDIDGTLMEYKKNTNFFDDKILKMFKKLKENDYIVVLASGRDYISIGNLHLSKNVDYFIGANGAFIYSSNLKDDLWSTTLSIKDFENYKKEILDKNIDQIENIILSDNKNIYANSLDNIKDHWFWKDFSDSFKEFEKYENEINNDQFHLITINCLNKKLINISDDFFKKTNSSLGIQAFWNNGFFVSENDLNKAKTIKKLAKKLNIDTSEIIAFGDGENDIEMIKLVGLGIAMENAVDSLKKVANDTAGHVLEHGTYYKLKKLEII